MKAKVSLSLAAKIYAICIIMLLFLLAVASANYTRMTLVKNEVSDIANYTSPISKHVAKINILVLEQEISFERIVRLERIIHEQESVSLDEKKAYQQDLVVEQQRFNTLNQSVSDYLEKTRLLAEEATQSSQIRNDIITFARISPEITMLSQDHQRFAAMAVEILAASKQNDERKRFFLDQQLEQNETIFNQRIHRLQTWLAEFTHASILEIKHQDEQLKQFNIIVSLIALLVGITCSAWASRKLVAPLKSLISSSQAITEENYQIDLKINQQDEIGELAKSLTVLLQRVAQKERIRTSFHEYLDPRVIELLSDNPNYAKGKTQNITVLFSDIARFSKLSETLSPEALVAVINEYYNLAGQSLIKTRGVVDKFIGDAIIAFWGQPFVDEKVHARLACQGAIRQLEQLQHLRLAMPDLVGIRKGLPEIDIRIGLASGRLVLGNIGTEKTSSFTIIGAAVAMSEALEQLNKKLGTRILATEQTKALAGEDFQFRLVAHEIVNSGLPTNIYELLGYSADFDSTELKKVEFYETAMLALIAGEFSQAKKLFGSYLQNHPDDIAANYQYDQLCLGIPNQNS